MVYKEIECTEDKRNINTKINKNIYTKFKIVCLKKEIKIKEGVEEAFNMFIEKNTNIV